jgi:hypothetical protein
MARLTPYWRISAIGVDKSIRPVLRFDWVYIPRRQERNKMIGTLHSISSVQLWSNPRRFIAAAAAVILCLTTFAVVPDQASAATYASTSWVDPTTGDSYEVDYTSGAFNGPATLGAPSLIQSDGYVEHASADETYQFCQDNPFPGYYPNTQQCLHQATDELSSDRNAIDSQLGEFASCRATVGRKLLASTAKKVKLVFATGVIYYGYSVLSQYASHNLPQHIGETATTHVLAILLASTVILTGLLALLPDTHLSFRELIAVASSWYGNTQMRGYIQDLATFRDHHYGETISRWFMDHSGVAHPSCAQIADAV